MQPFLQTPIILWASKRWQFMALVALGVAHRIAVFARFHGAIDHLTAHLGNLILIQLYPVEIYRRHFGAAMWLLQKTPPLPHLVIKAALMLAAFPLGVTHLLFFLQAAISIATACLLARMIARLTGSRALGFALAAWFLLSTDLLVLENTMFAEGFYENLGMLLATLCCDAAIRGASPRAVPDTASAAWSGLFAALAALTRSSLSYFAVVPLLAMLPRRRPAMLAACLAPVFLLQGGWAVKNLAVYGYFNWQTSDWGGYSAAKGLDADSQGPLLCRHIMNSSPGTYKEWFVASVRACPYAFTNDSDAGMPAWVHAQDEAVAARMGGEHAILNSTAARLKSAQYAKAALRYEAAHPVLALRRFFDLYPMFWWRMADYGIMLADPFLVEPHHAGLLDFAGRLFDEWQFVTTDLPKYGAPITRPATFFTLSLGPLDAVSILILHGVFPILAVLDLWRRRLAALLPPGTWVVAWAVLYGAFVFNAVDAGENMRFRLAVEPEIIALTASCVIAVIRAVTGRLGAAPHQPPLLGRGALLTEP